MKIGAVTTSYPRFPGDPAGNFVAGHVAALRALGHGVEVIAAGEGHTATRAETATGTGIRTASASAADHDAGVLRVGSSRLFYAGGAPDLIERAPIGAAVRGVVFTARLTAAVMARAGRWDRVIAHWLVPSAIAALPCSVPLLAIAHGGDIFTLRRFRLLGPVLRALHRRDARLVFVSEPLRAIAGEAAPELARWLGDAVVQPMGIDVARFAALVRAPSDPPIVLVAARLVPIKGVDVAIAAMRYVRSHARLVIAGNGPERARLAAAAAPHSFLGEVTTEQRDELLRAASVVVIPSRVMQNGRTEGTPAIALEALAAGVPVIASSVGGLCDVPGVRLVPPENPRELAHAIDHVLAQPPPAAALRNAVANLDWREIAPRLLRE